MALVEILQIGVYRHYRSGLLQTLHEPENGVGIPGIERRFCSMNNQRCVFPAAAGDRRATACAMVRTDSDAVMHFTLTAVSATERLYVGFFERQTQLWFYVKSILLLHALCCA